MRGPSPRLWRITATGSATSLTVNGGSITGSPAWCESSCAPLYSPFQPGQSRASSRPLSRRRTADRAMQRRRPPQTTPLWWWKNADNRVASPRRFGDAVSVAAPQIDHLDTVAIDGESCPEYLAAVQIAAERVRRACHTLRRHHGDHHAGRLRSQDFSPPITWSPTACRRQTAPDGGHDSGATGRVAYRAGFAASSIASRTRPTPASRRAMRPISTGARTSTPTRTRTPADATVVSARSLRSHRPPRGRHPEGSWYRSLMEGRPRCLPASRRQNGSGEDRGHTHARAVRLLRRARPRPRSPHFVAVYTLPLPGVAISPARDEMKTM